MPSPWESRSSGWWLAHSRVTEVVPERLEVHIEQPTSAGHIEAYRLNPEQGELPCVVATTDGRWVVLDGKHHTIAAAIEGRPVRCRVAEEPAGTPRPRWLRAYAPVHHTPEVRQAADR